jgi:hypothetical protein
LCVCKTDGFWTQTECPGRTVGTRQ